MKLLLIGPLPPPITGVSIANKIILSNLPTFNEVHMDSIDMSYSNFSSTIGSFSLPKALFFCKKYKDIFKIFKAHKVYMTIGQTFAGTLKYAPFIFAAKTLNKETIIHIHGDYLWREYDKLSKKKRKVFKMILSLADKGIVLSSSLKRNLEPFLPHNKIYILSNFVEDYLFKINIDYKLKKNFSELRIFYLSNLMKEKGILDLLKALLILKKKKIPFKAKIAGNINMELQAIIKNYFNQLKDSVEYLGVVSGKNKKDLLYWGNLFVFPTYYKMEGQPISILEAYATGNIVLTTKHAGIPDIFKDNINGFYIPKKNPLEIARKLEFLSKKLQNYKYIAINNHNEAKEKYTVEKFIINLTKILEG